MPAAETSPVAMAALPSSGHGGHRGLRRHHQHDQAAAAVPHQPLPPPERAITPELSVGLLGPHRGISLGLGPHSVALSPAARRHTRHHLHRQRHQPPRDDDPRHRPGPPPPSEWPSSPHSLRAEERLRSQHLAPPSSTPAEDISAPAEVSPAPTTSPQLRGGVGGGFPAAALLSSSSSSSALTTPPPPPSGPAPLRLSRPEVDELYDVLSAVLSALDALGVPHVLIGTSLLGSVRSKSLPFHEDGIDVAVIDDEDAPGAGGMAVDPAGEGTGEGGGGGGRAARVGRYERVVRDLPPLLHRAARARFAAEGGELGLGGSRGAVEYIFQRPVDGAGGGCCDRVSSSRAPRVGVDVYVLRRYRTARDLLRLISVDDDGRTARPLGEIERIVSEIDASASPAGVGAGTGRSAYPLYHFDSRRAVERWPRHYFLPDELLPIRREYDFGPVRGAPGPQYPVRALRRFHGDDCFTHYARVPAPGQGEAAAGSPPGGTTGRRVILGGEERVPLDDGHYVPLQHSRPERRVPYAHGRHELERFLSSSTGWYTASADAGGTGGIGGAGQELHGDPHLQLQIPDMDGPRPSLGRGSAPRLQRALPSMHTQQLFGGAAAPQQPLPEEPQPPPQAPLPAPAPTLALNGPQPQPQQQWSLLSSSMQRQTHECFTAAVRRLTGSSPDVPEFDQALREAMEPYISRARDERQRAREAALAATENGNGPAGSSSAAGTHRRRRSTLQQKALRYSTVRVPYPKLRSERPFLFDVGTYPLHQILADTVGVDDLSMIHDHPIEDKRVLFDALLHRHTRRSFHECYDNFVTSFCIPLLHSLAMTQGTFDSNAGAHRAAAANGLSGHRDPRGNGIAGGGGGGSPDAILYRYQAFPCLRVVRPGESSDETEPHCDVARGHSVGDINFHIPLTPAFGTNALYAESHPGREDWHPLATKALGLGYVYDGARCLHFGLENTTDRTRVSLTFRIAVARCSGATLGRCGAHHRNTDGNAGGAGPAAMDEDADDVVVDVDDSLCSDRILRDAYAAAGPGYYDEAVIDSGSVGGGGGGGRGRGGNAMMTRPGLFRAGPGPVVVKKYGVGGRLLDPDRRVGFPFA